MQARRACISGESCPQTRWESLGIACEWTRAIACARRGETPVHCSGNRMFRCMRKWLPHWILVVSNPPNGLSTMNRSRGWSACEIGSESDGGNVVGQQGLVQSQCGAEIFRRPTSCAWSKPAPGVLECVLPATNSVLAARRVAAQDFARLLAQPRTSSHGVWGGVSTWMTGGSGGRSTLRAAAGARAPRRLHRRTANLTPLPSFCGGQGCFRALGSC